MQYNKLTADQKINLIKEKYISQGMSFSEIATSCDTYANKVRRDAIKYNIPIRDKSQAQKNVLSKGKSKHPTKGKERTDAEKNKIGLSMYHSWQEMPEEKRRQRKIKSKELWSKLSQDEKANRRQAAHLAIRQSSKEGSKLEKFLLNKLIEYGYKVEFHKEQVLSNTKLQIDLYLPEITTAIEVDGPSHFEPVWGDDTLAKNQKYDKNKTGLIIGRGMRLVRVEQQKDFSPTRAGIIFQKLLDTLNNIDTKNGKTFFIKDE